MSAIYRTLADGLVQKAEELPENSAGARHLRDAAAALLDADMAIEREFGDPPAPVALGSTGRAA